MENNIFETARDIKVEKEKSYREQLKEDLALATKERNEIFAKKDEYFNTELLNDYYDAVAIFGDNSDAFKAYIEEGHENLADNYEKFIFFRDNFSKPANFKINIILEKLEKLKKEEELKQRECEQKEEAEKFKKEKEKMTAPLYEKLFAIYKKIPKEAKDCNMTDENAITKYFPELIGEVLSLEYKIKTIEDAVDYRQLPSLKE